MQKPLYSQNRICTMAGQLRNRNPLYISYRFNLTAWQQSNCILNVYSQCVHTPHTCTQQGFLANAVWDQINQKCLGYLTHYDLGLTLCLFLELLHIVIVILVSTSLTCFLSIINHISLFPGFSLQLPLALGWPWGISQHRQRLQKPGISIFHSRQRVECRAQELHSAIHPARAGLPSTVAFFPPVPKEKFPFSLLYKTRDFTKCQC